MITHREVLITTKTELSTIEWLIRIDYLSNELICRKCTGRMKLTLKIIKSKFKCSTSIYLRSIFQFSKIKIFHEIDITYYWVLGFNTGINQKTNKNEKQQHKHN